MPASKRPLLSHSKTVRSMKWDKIKYPTCLACCFFALAAQADSCQTATGQREIRACFEKARNCAAIAHPSERLSCYDGIHGPTPPISDSETMASKPTVETPTADPALTPDAKQRRASVARLDDEKFPLNSDAANTPKREPLSMQAKIVKLQKSGQGKMLITLNNDQIWQETRKSSVHYRIGATIVIKAGAFGSNNLTLEGQNRISKVKRIR